MTDLNFKVIGMKIRERRKLLGITQEAMARQLEVNPSHICNIECGRANPSLTALVQIANILRCSVDYFIRGEYTFPIEKDTKEALGDLDNRILDRLKYFDADKKEKILKIMELLWMVDRNGWNGWIGDCWFSGFSREAVCSRSIRNFLGRLLFCCWGAEIALQNFCDS